MGRGGVMMRWRRGGRSLGALALLFGLIAAYCPQPAEEGGYMVTVPALSGLVIEGETLEEARAMAKDAIYGYLESLRKHGEAIPIEQGEPITERVLVSLSGA